MGIALGGLYLLMPTISQYVFSNTQVLRVFEISLSLTQYDNRYYQELFVNLSRLMLISPLLLAVSSIFGAYLQAHKRFISTSLAPFMYNVGIVLGIYLFVRFAPQFGVYALSYSVLLGTVFHFITQLIGLLSMHDNSFVWSFRINKYVKEIGRLSLPRIFGLGVEQTAIMFNTFWGFTLGTGALSVFKFASTLHLVPVDLLTGSFLQIIFPRLNERAHEDDNYRSLNKLYWRTLTLALFVAIPIMILFMVLRLPIVRLVFGAGRFSWTATVVTSFTLAFFAPAIILQTVAALNIRTFYAINNTKIPFFVSLIGVTLNIIFSIGFTNFFSHYQDLLLLMQTPSALLGSVSTMISWFFWRNGSFASVAGLALGITIGLLVEVAASFFLLAKKTGLLVHARETRSIIPQMKRLFWDSVMSFFVSYGAYRLFDSLIDTTRTFGVLLTAGGTTVITVAVYAMLTKHTWQQYIDLEKVKARVMKFFNRTTAELR
jgi:putative peptidoglycan lipid II flippase